MKSVDELVTTIAVTAALTLFGIWLGKWSDEKVSAEGVAKEVKEASARFGAFASTAVGGLLAGLFFYQYYRGNLPPPSTPLEWFSVAAMALWVFFCWLKWLRLRRR